MDTQLEDKETKEIPADTETSKLSPSGISAMQGVEINNTENAETNVDQEQADQQSQSDQKTVGDDQVDATTYPHIGGKFETDLNKESEPIPIKVPPKDNPPLDNEDKEGKEPPKPPEGWSPGGLERGG